MGRKQCNKCTRFFDPDDPKDPCWCEPAKPPDTFVERAVAFFVSCYHSVEPKRAEVLVNFVVCHADSLPAGQRYSLVDEAARVADAKDLRPVVQQSLSVLAALTVLPPIVDTDTCQMLGYEMQPQEPTDIQRWFQDAVLDHPMTLSVALCGWSKRLGFPGEFCDNLTLEYSVELAEWILGARRS